MRTENLRCTFQKADRPAFVNEQVKFPEKHLFSASLTMVAVDHNRLRNALSRDHFLSRTRSQHRCELSEQLTGSVPKE